MATGLLLALTHATAALADSRVADWPASPRALLAAAATRRSPRSRPENVSKLRVVVDLPARRLLARQLPAAGESRQRRSSRRRIVVDGRLLFTTPRNRVIALDPETGRELWTFDPKLERGGAYANMWINRGVAYWRGGERDRRRARARLPRNPRRAPVRARRGDGRAVRRLRRGRQREPARRHRAALRRLGVQRHLARHRGRRRHRGRLVDRRRAAPRRAARRRARVRRAHRRAALDVPHDSARGRARRRDLGDRHAAHGRGERLVDHHRRSRRAAGCSCPSARRAPTSTAATGSARTCTATRSSRSTRATGEIRWHFQTVHHDLWDYDLAAPPVLADAAARRASRSRPSRRRPSTGFVFVLDRATGAPLFPVEERPVPASDRARRARAGRRSPCRRRRRRSCPSDSSEAISTRRLPRTSPRAREQLAELRNDGLFTPPSLRGSVDLSVHGRRRELVGRARGIPCASGSSCPCRISCHVIRLEEVGRARDRRRRRRAAAQRPRRCANLYWLLTGRGTGERYRLNPTSGRTVFAHDGMPVQQAAVGHARGGRSRARRDRVDRVRPASRDDDPGTSGYGPALVTASGLVFHGGTRQSGAARARHRAPARASRPSRCPRVCTPARSATSCGPTASAVPRDRAGRARRASARRSATT